MKRLAARFTDAPLFFICSAATSLCKSYDTLQFQSSLAKLCCAGLAIQHGFKHRPAEISPLGCDRSITVVSPEKFPIVPPIETLAPVTCITPPSGKRV